MTKIRLDTQVQGKLPAGSLNDGAETINGAKSFTDDLAVNTNTLFVDVSASNVGIGTISPNAKLEVKNDTTSNGLFIDQNGNGKGLVIDTMATTSTNYGLEILAKQGARALNIDGPGTVNVTIGLDAAEGRGMRVYDNDVSSYPLAYFYRDNASATGPSLWARNDGTGNGLLIDQNGNGTALNIDTASTVQAPIRVTNFASDPTGAHIIGDIAVVGGKLKICTVAGTPGTWTVVGTQT